MPTYKVRGYDVVAPSRNPSKKYDVYHSKTGKFVTSFGAIGYQQYHDKFGYYKKWDHGSEVRRKSYRARHANDYINDPNHAGFWSYRFLW